MINPDIFKAYDVRGLYPQEVSEELFQQLGRAFVAYPRPGPRRRHPRHAAVVAVADRRVHRRRDHPGRARDRLRPGRHRHDVLRGGQPTASTAARRSPPRTIPSSTTAASWCARDAFPLSGESGIKEMKEMMLAGTLPPPAATPRHGDARRHAWHRYVEHVMAFIDPSGRSSRSTPCSTPAAASPASVAPQLFDRLPCRTTRLCFEVDGTFPNHEANPLIEENRARHRRRGHAPGRPTSGSPGTATPTAASSSTAAASSSPATSSRRCSPRPS